MKYYAIKKNIYAQMEQRLKYIKSKKQYRMVDKKMDTAICVKMGEIIYIHIYTFVYVYTHFVTYIKIISKDYTRNTDCQSRE